jgi:hypothetical protein
VEENSGSGFKGSDAMLMVSRMPKEISDSIGYYDSEISFEEENVLKLTDRKYQNDFIKLDKFPSGRGFSFIKPGVEVLGKTVEKKNTDQANFIKVKFGKGISMLIQNLFFLPIIIF